MIVLKKWFHVQSDGHSHKKMLHSVFTSWLCSLLIFTLMIASGWMMPSPVQAASSSGQSGSVGSPRVGVAGALGSPFPSKATATAGSTILPARQKQGVPNFPLSMGTTSASSISTSQTVTPPALKQNSSSSALKQDGVKTQNESGNSVSSTIANSLLDALKLIGKGAGAVLNVEPNQTTSTT